MVGSDGFVGTSIGLYTERASRIFLKNEIIEYMSAKLNAMGAKELYIRFKFKYTPVC